MGTAQQRPGSARVRRQNHKGFVQSLRFHAKRERIRKQIQSRTSAQRQNIREADKEIRACQREVRAAFSAVMMRSSAKNHSRLGKMSSRLDSRRKKKNASPTITPTIPMVTVSHKYHDQFGIIVSSVL